MNKDIIYIDVEDDITAIIGKVKGAKEKIVALVPPKRIGILQSAVNLRLLARAGNQSNKRLVIITNNSALMALASAAQIPVAKNLQTKPSLADVPAYEQDDGDDVIDGASLPVGELARTADTVPLADEKEDKAIEAAVKENAAEKAVPLAVPPLAGQALRTPRARRGTTIPNFDKFRKKLALIIAGGVLLIAFLVWALLFAGQATIIITARTSDTSVNPKVTLGTQLTTDTAKGTLLAISQQLKKDQTVNFTATGTKDVGNKAQGQVVFQNCESLASQTVPAGTSITASGLNYVTQQDVIVPAGSGGLGGCTAPGQSKPVAVVAADLGPDYNVPSGTVFSVPGRPNSSSTYYFNAVASTAISGGSKQQVKVVTDQDIKAATDQLAAQQSADIKKQLASQFPPTAVAVDATFTAVKGATTSNPAVGAESPDGKATLTVSMTYGMLGVDRSEVGRFLDPFFSQQLQTKPDQRVYNNGADKASFTDVSAKQNDYAATLVATAQVGPKIDDLAVKNNARGKNYGEIQSQLQGISGVDNVDIKFSPFWVSTAPNDIKRIAVEFKLNGAK